MSGLIDFNLTTNFGKNGLTPEGWKQFTRSLEKRFDELDNARYDDGEKIIRFSLEKNRLACRDARLSRDAI